jgi:uncharacterized membrane protein YfcA
MISLPLLFLAATACELVDSGLGMMYGTILSPLLMLCGFVPRDVVPAILLSQAAGGIVASVGHHERGNADLRPGSVDFSVASAVAAAGIVASACGAYVAIKIPPHYLLLYVGILVAIMGVLVLRPRHHAFSWSKVGALGVLSAFNKAMSGGGYGPLMTSGLILAGRKSKSSVAITDLAEVPICIASLVAWLAIGRSFPSWRLYLPLFAGAALGSAIGPIALSKIRSEASARRMVGYLALMLGIGCTLGVLAT